MHDIFEALVVGTAASMGLGVWLWSGRPRPLQWAALEGRAGGWGNALAAWVRRHLRPAVLAQAEMLEISSRELLGSGLVMAAIAGTVVGGFLPVHWLGLPIAAATFGVAPSLRVRWRFGAYQRAMRGAFEPHVLLLRIYFDLGMALPTALRLVREALSGDAQRAMDRLLGDLTEGHRDAALHAWAERTQLMEYQVLADTLVQQRGRALRGAALDPLDTLLTASRQQSMKTRTDRLLAGAPAIPILASLSVVLLYFYALIAGVQGLQALHFHW